MAVTLAQAKLLTQDKLTQFVIDEFRKDPILDKLIFDDDVAMGGGSSLAYVYNRVTTLPTAATRAINAEYVAQHAVTTQITANLKVFGGSFDIDRVIANHVKGITNQVSFQMDQKIKATKALFADLFINGDSAQDVTAFDGLDKAVTGSSTEANTAADIDLNSSADIDSNFKTFMDALDLWLATLDGSPDAIVMNKKMFAVMQAIARRSNSFTAPTDEFGRKTVAYSGIPFVEVGDKPGTSNPIIPIAAGITSIYAVRFGLDGVHGVTPDGSSLVKTYLPDFKTAGAVKKGEVEMVACMALKSTRAAGAFRRLLIS
ncbi:MAG: major capsid protein [Eubacteriales bacterium]